VSIWATAGAAIDAAFADPEPLIYTGAGLTAEPISAIRSDTPAPDFQGPGNTLRSIVYEVDQADLPDRPSKTDRFEHRERRWRVDNVVKRDDVGKWELTVVDDGALP
jgi:hypothetical protein